MLNQIHIPPLKHHFTPRTPTLFLTPSDYLCRKNPSCILSLKRQIEFPAAPYFRKKDRFTRIRNWSLLKRKTEPSESSFNRRIITEKQVSPLKKYLSIEYPSSDLHKRSPLFCQPLHLTPEIQPKKYNIQHKVNKSRKVKSLPPLRNWVEDKKIQIKPKESRVEGWASQSALDGQKI